MGLLRKVTEFSIAALVLFIAWRWMNHVDIDGKLYRVASNILKSCRVCRILCREDCHSHWCIKGHREEYGHPTG